MSEHKNPVKIPNALPLGYRFNEFEIKEVLGGGGFGIVYRARDHQLDRDIAIKEFMPASLAVRNDNLNLVLRSERFAKTFHAGLNSFIQEARLLARFNHPNLVHVLRFWVQNDTAYMGTTFYSGTSLAQVREHSPHQIDEHYLRHLLPPLMGAIKTLHDAGVLHRDISPDNIQIQENGEPVLLDLGSARRTISDLADESETMLRPGYAPIEQYSDNDGSEQGAWTDIYALGAVLHTLITGAPPPVSVVRSIEDNYQPLAQQGISGYSPELLHAVDSALALQPEDRPQSIDEFAALITLSEQDPLTRAPGTMLVPLEEEKPEVPASQIQTLLKHRFALPVLVAAGVLVGFGLGVMVSGDDSSATSVVQNTSSPVQETSQPTKAIQAEMKEEPPVAATEKVVASATTPTEPPTVTAPPAEPVAQVYIRLQQGESVQVNGKAQALVPELNGFARLQLVAGHYTFVVSGQSGTRTQTLDIRQKGVWLLDPLS